MEPPLPFLENHWRRCFEAVRLPMPAGVFPALVERYRESHRAYHTLQHIGECIGHLGAIANPPAELGLAIWFHDSVFDPHASDNEKRSAAWARAVLGEDGVGYRVAQMILATVHTSLLDDRGLKLMADIDLAILAAPEPRYSEYQSQIRQEYTFLDDAAYRAGRRKLLQSFVDRPFVYATPEFRARLESRARKNLERSINAIIVAKR